MAKKKSKKKSSKALGKKKKQKKRDKRGGITAKQRLAKARAAAETVNKKLKGRGRVDVGADLDLEWEHERSGNPAFDYVTNGGPIPGTISQIWGPYGSSKTSLLAFIIKEWQARGKVCACGFIEPLDKSWWRQIGVYIPFNQTELENMTAKVRKKAMAYNAHYEKKGWAPLTVIQHKQSDYVLQLVFEMTKTNVFDLIGVDSLAAIKSSRILEEKTLLDPNEYGGEASLFSRFCGFMSSALNTWYDKDGNPDKDGKFSNQTSIVCLNQARQVMSTRARAPEKTHYAPGGMALKHAWSQSVFAHRVEEHADLVNYDGMQRRDVYAVTFRLFGDKMRGGPPFREARFKLHVKQHVDEDGRLWKAGEIEAAGTLRALGVQLGVIEQSGAWLQWEDVRVQGKAGFDDWLEENRDEYGRLYEAVLLKAQTDSQASAVPDVTELEMEEM